MRTVTHQQPCLENQSRISGGGRQLLANPSGILALIVFVGSLIASGCGGSPAAPSRSQLAVSPSSLNFLDVPVGSTSLQNVTLTNTGSASLTLFRTDLSGSGFGISGLALPLALAVNQSSSFSVIFAPAAPDVTSGSVTLTSNAANSPTSISVSGRGIQGMLAVAPLNIEFGDVTVGTSRPQSVSLTNGGTASLTLSQISVSGESFSFAGLPLPLTLAVNQSHLFDVSFAPTGTGSAIGDITLASNASNSPTSVSLAGMGTPAPVGFLTANPSSLDFGDVTVGSRRAQSVTLTNSGSTSLTLSEATVSGEGFSLSGLSLPLTVTVNQSSSFSVEFAPTITGSVSGTASLTSTASNSPTPVSLSGNGVPPAVYLAWDANTSPDIAGHNVYRATQSGGPYTRLNASLISGTTFTDSNVQPGQTYYYVATAVDINDVESVFSNEVEATIPPLGMGAALMRAAPGKDRPQVRRPGNPRGAPKTSPI